jgi:hypothetical protein
VPDLAGESQVIEDALKNYSTEWSNIRFISMEILRCFIISKLKAGDSLHELDNINNFAKFLRFTEIEWSDSFDYSALESATKSVGECCTLPTSLPLINGYQCKSMCNLIGREIQRDLHNCLWMNMIQWQKKSIDLILEQNKHSFLITGIDLIHSPSDLTKASFCIRKHINAWEFGESISIDRLCAKTRRLIVEFKHIFDLKSKQQQQQQQLSLSKFKLKQQNVSTLLNVIHQMIEKTKTYLIDQSKYRIEFIPSKSNKVTMIPFDAAVFSAVFGNIIGRRQMRQVFDISRLKTNHHFDDYIRTNGIKICFQFKRKQKETSIVQMKQISTASLFISLTIMTSISKDLSKINS